MGLAAGQARLLSITARKSDCEFQSMRLSHQKIAMARELADLSNEYQDSLQMTKLVYDYYGKGDTSMALSYSLLMSPSALNDYMPITVTDSLGRVTLNSKLAAAARKAGIPQEGLGCLPSEVTRNLFIMGLAEQGTITTDMANKITGLPYNQAAGFGGGATVATVTEQGNYNQLLEYMSSMDNAPNINITINGSMVHGDRAEMKLITSSSEKAINANADSGSKTSSFSLADLLSGKETVQLYTYNRKGKNIDQDMGVAAQTLLEDILKQVGNSLAGILDIGDGVSASALDYAMNSVMNLYMPKDENGNYRLDFATNGEYFNAGTGVGNAPNYFGWVGEHYKRGLIKWGHNHNKNQVDINNMIQAYITFFADYMNGISKQTKDGHEVFDVKKGQLSEGNFLAKDNTEFLYTWKIGSDVSSNDLGQATFYDTLFNQICANGWTENQRIEENDYMREMLQNGMQFISKVKDDGYYYQGNYATDPYIKEVADESAIAQAEARYSTEKAKLNAKEETIDMKMKNLDTEISSLTTEYDTVKSTISKNIEKSFKRYNA